MFSCRDKVGVSTRTACDKCTGADFCRIIHHYRELTISLRDRAEESRIKAVKAYLFHAWNIQIRGCFYHPTLAVKMKKERWLLLP